VHERGGPTISTPPNSFNRTLTPDALAWQPTGRAATITRRWKFIDPINLHRIWAFRDIIAPPHDLGRFLSKADMASPPSL
jgi:hypothetical protein